MRPELPELDREADLPLASQIAAFYARSIGAGQLRPGERLPTIRAIADGCGVTRTVVHEAYRRLAERGLVVATVGRGTVVADLAVGAASAASDLPGVANDETAPTRGEAFGLSPYADAALRRSQDLPAVARVPDDQQVVADFADLMPDEERFPVDEWRQAMDSVLRARGGELLGYGQATNGLPGLRALLAERMHEVDPRLGPDDLLVTAGAQQALDLVLRTFCSPGDAVVVTAPSYHQMHGLLRAHGLDVVQVPFTARGIHLGQLERALRRPNVRLCYLMPTFHNPTGRTLDLDQRRALLEVLAPTRVVLVEDEYQTSLRCRGEALPTLRALDARGATVTVATMSKELFPALRIGWVAAGARLLRPMAAVKRFMDLETSPLLQAALVEFMQRGSLDRYIDGLRRELAKRHEALQRAAAAHLPDGCTVTAPDGGFVAWLEFDPAASEPGSGERLAVLAAERGVRVAPGQIFDLHAAPSRGVRLSLTRAGVDQIEAGLRVLGECARELAREPLSFRPFL